MKPCKMRLAPTAMIPLFFLLISGMTAPPVGAAPPLILADASGSMRETVEVLRRDFEGPDSDAEEGETIHVPKIEVMRTLLVRLVEAMPETTGTVGVYRLRYIAGNPARYAVFLEPEPRETKETVKRLTEDFSVEYPVFNRRTDLADGLRQFDETVLSEMEGERSVLLLSDGRESFYDLDRDREAAASEETDEEKAVRGPLTETGRLRKVYGEVLSLFTVYLDRTEPEEEEEPEGRRLLEEMARSGGGRFFDGAALLNDIGPLAEAFFGREQ